MTPANPQPPRVLHVIADGSPGGGTTFLLELLAALDDAPPAAVLTQADSPLLRSLRDRRVPVRPAPFFRWHERWTVAPVVRCAVRDFNCSLIHVHGARAGRAVLAAKLPSSCPMVYTLHGLHHLHQPAPVRWMLRRLHRRLVAQARMTTFVSDADRQLALADGMVDPSTPTRVIHNGIDLNGFTPAPHPPAGKVVAFCGRLDEPKDPLLFVRILAALRPLGCRGLMIGGGPLASRVDNAITQLGLAPILERTGEIERERAISLLRERASLLVMPSRWEGLGLAAIEAQAMGLPVVAADVGGLRESVCPLHGNLVASRDPAAYVAPIIRLLDDVAAHPQTRQTVRQFVQLRFDRAIMAAGYREVYQQVEKTR